MAKKTIKKYQTPGSVVSGPPKRTKEVVVSPSGDYRTTNRSRSNPNLYTQSSRTRRTVQGALKGVPKVDMNNPPHNSAVPLTPPPSGSFMKRGGSKKVTIAKKYQLAGGVIDQVKGIAAGIKANTKKKPTTTPEYRNYIAAAERSLLTPGRVDYLGDNRKPFPVKDAVRIAVGKGEQKKKFTRAPHPSDVLGKPKYLKKEMKGGTIKKKK